MSGKAISRRRAARHVATRDEIVRAAWDVVREQGLAGLTMRDLGARVGMTAQSLYTYFSSKHDIYDAMFAEGQRSFLDWMADVPDDPDPVVVATFAAQRYFHFCTDDPVRFQLMFQRTIPGFEPSEESFALALEAYGQMAARLASFGITEQTARDLWTAVMTGLASQQIANDPGGSRWEACIADAVAMLLAYTAPVDHIPPHRPTRGTTR